MSNPKEAGGLKAGIKQGFVETVAPRLAKHGKNYGFSDGVIPDTVEASLKFYFSVLAAGGLTAEFDLNKLDRLVAELSILGLTMGATRVARDITERRHKSKK